MTVSEGYYADHGHDFEIRIKSSYPHDPPKVTCTSPIFHPNIDAEGHVCLNIVREDWRPIFSVSVVILGLYDLLLNPHAEEGLNEVASNLMLSDLNEFIRMVARAHDSHSLRQTHR